MLDNQKELADEQRKLAEWSRCITSVLERYALCRPFSHQPLHSVEWLQKHVLGEVTDVKSVLFYALAFLLATLLTAARPTARARLPLYLLLLFLVVTERRARLAGIESAYSNAGGVFVRFARRTVSHFWLRHGRTLVMSTAVVVLLVALSRSGRTVLDEKAPQRLEERMCYTEKTVAAPRGRGDGAECSELLEHIELLVGRNTCPVLEWRPEFESDDESDDEYVPEHYSDDDDEEEEEEEEKEEEEDALWWCRRRL